MATQAHLDHQTVNVSLPDEDFAVLERLARARNTSVDGYVRDEVLLITRSQARVTRSPEEVQEIIRAAQEEMRTLNPEGRDLVAELIAERRREAALE
jgi:hypothetical protein